MGDSLTTIIAIFLAAILMFVFPLAAIADRNDDTSQMYVQSALDTFVNKASAKGKIAREDYEQLEAQLASTNNSYDIEITVNVADVNPGKKSDNKQVGDTTYYGVFDAQVKKEINDNGAYPLKEGYYIIVSAKNNNNTVSQMIKNVLYGITGNESYVISAKASAIVVSTGY